MAVEKDELVDQFVGILKKLRTTCDYDNVLGTLAENLNLSGAPAAAMKALLIHIVLDTFGTSIKAEVVLVGLGLLQGYDNQYQATSDDVARNMLTERRIKFLQESNYLEGRFNRTTKKRYTGFEDVAKDGDAAIDTVVASFGKNDGYYTRKVAEALCNKAGLAQYLEDSVRRYGITNGDQLIDVKLPVLRYPRTVNITTTDEDAVTQPTPETAKTEDITSNQESEQAESTDTVPETEQIESTGTVPETEQEKEQTETVSAKATADQDTATPAPDPDSHSQPDTQPQPDPAPQPQPASIPNSVTENAVQQNAFLVRVLGVVSIIAVACLAFVFVWQSLSQRAAYNSLSDTMALPEIESINFAELDEPPTLAPGESVVLELEIEPKVYLPEDLDYYSDKVWAAYTNKNEVIANPELASTVDEVVAITAQKGPVEDTINVLVRGTDAAGSGGIGNGANGPDGSMEGGE